MEEFDTARKDDADAIAEMALENYVTMRDSVRDPKFQLKKRTWIRIGATVSKSFYPEILDGNVSPDAIFSRLLARQNSGRPAESTGR